MGQLNVLWNICSEYLAKDFPSDPFVDMFVDQLTKLSEAELVELAEVICAHMEKRRA